ncbi:aminoacyl-tRNA deacylase [Novosphingobium sp.]|uniref:aminoacyl-tRNA deacylase n=1 Tax=Novosphingobium sp. TaxID=1874826 RepID=UPI003D1269D0
MSIHDFLEGRRVRFETLLHRPAHSAAKLANSVHVPGRLVAKAVLVRAGEGFALAVLPATHRVDLPRLGLALGVESVRLATEAEVVSTFADCEPGALPPFGRLYGLRTVVDCSLAAGPDIVFDANTHHDGVRMKFHDFEALERPSRARFAEPIAPRLRRPDPRRAGGTRLSASTDCRDQPAAGPDLVKRRSSLDLSQSG